MMFISIIITVLIIVIIIRNSRHVIQNNRYCHQDHHDHLSHHGQDHDYLCKADGTAVVSVKRNSQLVIVPQCVRCALGLKKAK